MGGKIKTTAAWKVLSALAAAFMAAGSAAGIFWQGTYAREAVSWAAQGRGQDAVNLLFVFPVLVISLCLAYRGSTRAFLVSYGALLYCAYSYVLYSFFVHFGPVSPVYIAALGTSFYALLAGSATLREEATAGAFPTRDAPSSVFLIASGAVFAFLWLSQIIPDILSGTGSASAREIGFIVNPVHVMDLAFAIPVMIATGIFMKKGKAMEFSAPLLVFGATMGIAIVGMQISMVSAGSSATYAPAYFVGGLAAAGAALAVRSLRKMRAGVV